MTIEIVYAEPARRWVRADQFMSSNLQSISIQTDPTENQISVGVACRIGK